MFFYLKYLKWFISGAYVPRIERDEFILTNYNTYILAIKPWPTTAHDTCIVCNAVVTNCHIILIFHNIFIESLRK